MTTEIPAEKIVFQLNQIGELVDETTADESPLELGVYHIPANCVETVPPAHVDGAIRIYVV